MKKLIIVFLLCLFPFLQGCVPALITGGAAAGYALKKREDAAGRRHRPYLVVHHDETVDISSFETFHIVNYSSEASGVLKRIMAQMINDELNEKGYKSVGGSEEADFVVCLYHLNELQQQYIPPSVAYVPLSTRRESSFNMYSQTFSSIGSFSNTSYTGSATTPETQYYPIERGERYDSYYTPYFHLIMLDTKKIESTDDKQLMFKQIQEANFWDGEVLNTVSDPDLTKTAPRLVSKLFKDFPER